MALIHSNHLRRQHFFRFVKIYLILSVLSFCASIFFHDKLPNGVVKQVLFGYQREKLSKVASGKGLSLTEMKINSDGENYIKENYLYFNENNEEDLGPIQEYFIPPIHHSTQNELDSINFYEKFFEEKPQFRNVTVEEDKEKNETSAITTTEANHLQHYPFFLFSKDGTRPRIVNYYAPWCPHCIAYKSEFVTLAKETHKLDPSVEFYTVSCTAHEDLCMKVNIEFFPNVIYYPENSIEPVQLNPLYISDAKSLLNIMKMEKSEIEKREKLLETRQNNLYSFMSTGDFNSPINHPTNNETGVSGYMYERNHPLNNLKFFNDLMPTYEEGNILDTKTLSFLHANSESYQINSGINGPKKRKQLKLNAFSDASASLYFLFKSSIFSSSSGALSDEKKRVLGNWLDLLKHSLPPPSQSSDYDDDLHEIRSSDMWKLQHDMIHDLSNDLDMATSSRATFLEFIEKYHQSEKSLKWSTGCSYTCGLWQLFHIISVGLNSDEVLVVGGQETRNNRTDSSSSRDLISTMDAAERIKDLIIHFFRCSECVSNFQVMYDSCSFERCTKLTYDTSNSNNSSNKELSLWLWNMHNFVNVRLYKEKNSIPLIHDIEKALWPSRNDCAMCWNNDVDGTFNGEVMFRYLQYSYWPLAQPRRNLMHSLHRLGHPFLLLCCVSVLFILISVMHTRRRERSLLFPYFTRSSFNNKSKRHFL